MLKIVKIEKVEKMEPKFDFERKEQYEIRMEIEVSESDVLHGGNGVYLQVEYITDDQEINRYHFFEKGTDRYINAAFKDEQEEEMVRDYLVKYLILE